MIKYEYDSCVAPLDMLPHMMNAKVEAGWETWKVRVWGGDVAHVGEALLVFRRPVGWYAPDVDRARKWARAWKKLARQWWYGKKALWERMQEYKRKCAILEVTIESMKGDQDDYPE